MKALPRFGALICAVLVIGWMGGAPFMNVASHAPGDTTYTGCLGVTGKIAGKVSKIKAGSAPTKPCKSSEVEIHLSDGDITSITSGTGLTGGATNGDITLALLPSFQLPQGCSAGKIASFNGTGWSCASDADTTYSADNTAGVAFTSANTFGLVTCASGKLLKSTGTGWSCGDDTDTTYTAGDGITLNGTQFKLPACSVAQVLKYSGSAWLCASDADTVTTYSAGTGISLAGTTFSISLAFRLPQTCLSGQYVQWTGSAWDCAAPVVGRQVFGKTVVGSTGFGVSMDIGTDGLPVISYIDGSNKVQMIHCGNASCTSGNLQNLVAGVVANGTTQIVVGSDGFPAILYYDSGNGSIYLAHCSDAVCATKTLAQQEPVSPKEPSLAIGSDGFPIFSYGTAAGLRFEHCSSVTCANGVLTTLDGPNVGSSSAIAVGNDGFPIIAYRNDASADVKVFHCGNVTCSSGNTITPLDTDQGVETQMGIAIGTDGLPIIAFQSSGSDVRVVQCANLSCTAASSATTFDPGGDPAGYGASVAIGSDGLPLVAFGQIPLGSITKVLHCANEGCTAGQMNTVDTQNGWLISLVIGTDGLPVMVNQRNASTTGTGPFVVHCSSATCVPYQRP